MVISTLTSQSVCRRPRPPTSLPGPPPIDWSAVRRAAAVAAAASLVAQVSTVPLDVAIRAARASGAALGPSFARVVRQGGAGALFDGLAMHIAKRVPTKAATVALFELGMQRGNGNGYVPVAVAAGCTALVATYPVHAAYYAMRKGVALASIVQFVRTRPSMMYAGMLPAMLGVVPSVVVDYNLYRGLRQYITGSLPHELPKRQGRVQSAAVIAAAAMSSLAAGAAAEPLKALARRVAVQGLSCSIAPASVSLRATAASMMRAGPLSFWKGFGTRTLRYVPAAVMSKVTVQKLRNLPPQQPLLLVANEVPRRPKAPLRTLVAGNAACVKTRYLDVRERCEGHKRLRRRRIG